MKFTFIILAIVGGLLLTSCEDEANDSNTEKEKNESDTLKFNKEIKSLLQDDYLWYAQLNNEDPAKYSNSEEFFYAMLYKQNDRWSFMITIDEYNALFEEAKFFGHGFAMYKYNGKRRLAYVFKNTKVYKAGIRRGWIVKSINNTPIDDNTNTTTLTGSSSAGVSNSFVFQKPNGRDTSLTFAKEEVRMNMVLVADTYKIKNKTVGYLVFHGFIGNAKKELDSAFHVFKKANVDELIVDLRYNTGGELEIASQLANFIGGKIANNKVFEKITYNNKLSKYNEEIKFKQNDTSLNLNRVFFITSGESYSASEAVINGLIPQMSVKSIGNVSGGKPVGMNIFQFKKYGYMVAPITFKLTNSLGYGDYFNGLPVDQTEIDDLANDWGRNERCCKQAINYIANGSFIQLKSSETSVNQKIPKYTGLKAITHSLY